MTQNIFPLSSHSDRGLIIVIVYYFQIWNEKGYNIIISSVISNYMGPIYIETSSVCVCDIFSHILLNIAEKLLGNSI